MTPVGKNLGGANLSTQVIKPLAKLRLNGTEDFEPATINCCRPNDRPPCEAYLNSSMTGGTGGIGPNGGKAKGMLKVIVSGLKNGDKFSGMGNGIHEMCLDSYSRQRYINSSIVQHHSAANAYSTIGGVYTYSLKTNANYQGCGTNISLSTLKRVNGRDSFYFVEGYGGLPRGFFNIKGKSGGSRKRVNGMLRSGRKTNISNHYKNKLGEVFNRSYANTIGFPVVAGSNKVLVETNRNGVKGGDNPIVNRVVSNIGFFQEPPINSYFKKYESYNFNGRANSSFKLFNQQKGYFINVSLVFSGYFESSVVNVYSEVSNNHRYFNFFLPSGPYSFTDDNSYGGPLNGFRKRIRNFQTVMRQ